MGGGGIPFERGEGWWPGTQEHMMQGWAHGPLGDQGTFKRTLLDAFKQILKGNLKGTLLDPLKDPLKETLKELFP